MTDDIRYEVRDGIAWLTIDRPGARNALDRAARAAFRDASFAFAGDDGAQVLIVTATGDKAFSAGADLKEMSQTGMRVPAKDNFVHWGRDLDTDKPIIAAVNGHAFAGGFQIAMMADLVVSADHATYAVSELKVGRGAPWAVGLGRIVGTRVALELLTTGEPITAQRMAELGFVNRVVPFDRLLEEAERLARTIIANAPLTVRAGKRMVYRFAGIDWQADLEAADALWEHVYLSDDAQEGPLAFSEKRRPVWKGR